MKLFINANHCKVININQNCRLYYSLYRSFILKKNESWVVSSMFDKHFNLSKTNLKFISLYLNKTHVHPTKHTKICVWIPSTVNQL